MVYESSYESGMKPFQSDPTRGYWAQPSDFLYACWGLTFKLDIFSMGWYFFFELGVYSIIPHLICMALFVVPIILIQSYMGQFSSSGFISVFRLSPIFKGMGYISLAVNFSILTYYGIFAAIPLIYFFHSLRPTLPWSCEAFREWSNEAPLENDKHICDQNNTMSTTIMTPVGNSTTNDTEIIYHTFHIPSVLFFRSLFGNYNFPSKIDSSDINFSWQLIICMLLVWSLVAFVFYKINYVCVEKFGKLIRYTLWLLMAQLVIIVLRLSFLTEAKQALRDYFVPQTDDFVIGLYSVSVIAVSSFGVGWGAIISLASYNTFKTNIMRFSWYICLGQLLILVLIGLTTSLIDHHLAKMTNYGHYSMELHWVWFLSSASAIADMKWANMWSILFHSMLIISSLMIIVTQLFALLTAIFDDSENLRSRRQEVTLGLIGLLTLCSIYFCSNHGLSYFSALPADAVLTQIALNLLLLLVVLWVYGRVRFQRDIEFMLGQRFATWRVYVLRFIAPLSLLTALFMTCTIAYYEHYFTSVVVGIVAIFLIGIPWLFIPGYAVLRILQASGTLAVRFKRCCRPTDWYPANSKERQHYQEAMGNMDVTQQLHEVDGDETL